ncbi:MAG: hypothetical protein H6R01_24 [Burkholderiaceae bacterium]|nr:hypothetical protein [Burkholderiaceae bacterium]
MVHACSRFRTSITFYPRLFFVTSISTNNNHNHKNDSINKPVKQNTTKYPFACNNAMHHKCSCYTKHQHNGYVLQHYYCNALF